MGDFISGILGSILRMNTFSLTGEYVRFSLLLLKNGFTYDDDTLGTNLSTEGSVCGKKLSRRG